MPGKSAEITAPVGPVTCRAVSPQAKWSRMATSAGVLPLGTRRGAAVTGRQKSGAGWRSHGREADKPHRVVSRGETPRPILRKSPQSQGGQRAARTGLVTARRAFTACFCARPWACPFPRGGSCAQKCAPSPPRPEAAAGSCPSAKGQSAPPARAQRPAAAHNSA